MYAMMEIASEGNVEEKALMEHIINGIPDREYNKMILHQASTLEQLKTNLDVYDRIKEKLQYTLHTKEKSEPKGIGEKKNQMQRAKRYSATPVGCATTRRRAALIEVKARNATNATTSDTSRSSVRAPHKTIRRK